MYRSWHSITPLLALQDPRAVHSVQPTFLYAEFLLLALACCGIKDAFSRPDGLLTFVSCLVGGTAVELITILHGEMGNFYHSQGSIMLFGRREPLYMLLGCYGWVAYATMILAKRVRGGPAAQCAFAALLGSEAWALLDTVGAQFLWWTWHASEPLYADREGGVPVASSFWIMATMGSMALVLRRLPGGASPGWGLLAGPVASLLLMQLPFLAIFHPLVTFGELHASYAMWALRLGCAAPLLAAVLGAEGSPLGAWARALRSGQPETAVMRQMAAYALGMLLVAASSDPTAERRTSFSQPCARDRDCATDETSFWGAFTRKAHTCTRDNDPARDLYRLCDARCGHAAAPGLETHTVCGVPPEEGWLLLIAAHAVAVLLLVALPFRAPRPKAS
jgi:hypothetical protein